MKRVEKIMPAASGTFLEAAAGMVATAVAGAAVPVMGGGRDEVVLEAPRVQSQYDSSAAVTDVALFSVCPRKYFLARYVGWQAEGRGTGAVEFGIEVHKAMAGMETSSVEALELKSRFDASEMGRRLARAERAEREFDFMLAVEDVVFSGKIDAWFEEGGELVVLDYKTDRDEAAAGGVRSAIAACTRWRWSAMRGEFRIGRRCVILRSGRVMEVSLKREELEGPGRAVRGLACGAETYWSFR